MGMLPCNLRFLLEDLFNNVNNALVKDSRGFVLMDQADSNNWKGWNSSWFNKLEQDKSHERVFFRLDKKSQMLKVSKIGGTPKDTMEQTVFDGTGYTIANALRWGFNTDLDVARRLHISKRTADRLMHPNKNYANKNLCFKHTITIQRLDDDYQFHWVRRKSKHPDKYHKWDWKLSRNVSLGKYRPTQVVDEHTFEQYCIMFQSPLHKLIKNHYNDKPHSFLLQTLYHKQISIGIRKYQINMIGKLIKIFNNPTYRDEFYQTYGSFPNYLTHLNRIYVSIIYRAERLNHLRADWTMPIKPTDDLLYEESDPTFNVADTLHISPITLTLSPKYYIFGDQIKYTVTPAMLYWYLYVQKKYYLISYPKQLILHKAWMDLYQNKDKFRAGTLSKSVMHPDPNPNIKNPYLPRVMHRDKDLNSYINHWQH